MKRILPLLIVVLAVCVAGWFALNRSEVVPAPRVAEVVPVVVSEAPVLATFSAPAMVIWNSAGTAAEEYGEISGRVYTGDGAPAAGARVSARHLADGLQEPGAAVGFETRSGDEGAFRFANLPLGLYSLLGESDAGMAAVWCRLSTDRPYADETLVLGLAASLGGMVVGPAGEAIDAGTLYPVMRDGYPAKRSTWLGRAVELDETGAFLFPALDPGRWSIQVIVPGFSPTLSPPLEAGRLDTVIRLREGVSVMGRILITPSMEAAEDAVLVAGFAEVEGPVVAALQDGEGNFRFPSLAPGPYALFASEPTGAYVLEAEPVELVVANERIDDLTLFLVRSGGVEGRVLASDTGEGVRGVEIQVAPEEGEDSRTYTAVTDLGGRYSVSGLGAGHYTVRPGRHREYASADPKVLLVQVESGLTAAGIDFELVRDITIRGSVLDEESNPVAGARVSCRGCTPSPDVSSDSAGRFVIAGVTEGAAVTLYAASGGVQAEPYGPVAVSQAGLDNVELILSRDGDGVIAGILVDERDRPLLARISASSGLAGPSIVQGTYSGIDGRFVIAGLVPGHYRIGVVYERGPWTQLAEVEVHQDRPAKVLRLVYPVGDLAVIAGRLVDTQGHGIEGYVELLRQEGSRRFPQSTSGAAADGAFRFAGVTDGVYTVDARAEAYDPVSVFDVLPNTEGLELIFEPRPHISGRVVDAQGNPVTRFRMQLSGGGMGGPETESGERMVVDPEGAFYFPVVSGRYALTTKAEGFAVVETPVGIVELGRPAENILVTLPVAMPWRGRVVDAAGRPVQGAAVFPGEVSLKPGAAAGRESTTTGPDGTYQLVGLNSAHIPYVSAYHPELGSGMTPAPYLTESQLDDLVLHPTGSLLVTVTRDGEPVAGVYVSLSLGRTGTTAKVGEDGACFFDHLPSGTAKVEIVSFGSAFSNGSGSVEIVSGQQTELFLEY